MNEIHTFPIAEEEAHKLDQLRLSGAADLQQRTRSADEWVRSNATLTAGVALLLGIVVGRLLK